MLYICSPFWVKKAFQVIQKAGDIYGIIITATGPGLHTCKSLSDVAVISWCLCELCNTVELSWWELVFHFSSGFVLSDNSPLPKGLSKQQCKVQYWFTFFGPWCLWCCSAYQDCNDKSPLLPFSLLKMCLCLDPLMHHYSNIHESSFLTKDGVIRFLNVQDRTGPLDLCVCFKTHRTERMLCFCWSTKPLFAQVGMNCYKTICFTELLVC